MSAAEVMMDTIPMTRTSQLRQEAGSTTVAASRMSPLTNAWRSWSRRHAGQSKGFWQDPGATRNPPLALTVSPRRSTSVPLHRREMPAPPGTGWVG